jgi:two-component system phosphate regulon sensor histidine kinase PhoR
MAGALYLAYNLTSRYVENDFASQKIDVLEQTVKPYNDFFQNKIPEISFYQGYLDSAQTSKYVDTIFRKFSFVERVMFYDTEVSNHRILEGIRVKNFSMGPKSVFQFGRDLPKDSISLYKNTHRDTLFVSRIGDEFNKMAIKFSGFIELADTAQALNDDDRFSVFYSIRSNRITFMNIPRREEIKIYKELMYHNNSISPIYEMDMLTFSLNPQKLEIINSHPELYQNISIKPLVYESIDNDDGFVDNELPLSGPFSDYKLYFSSGKDFLMLLTMTFFR